MTSALSALSFYAITSDAKEKCKRVACNLLLAPVPSSPQGPTEIQAAIHNQKQSVSAAGERRVVREVGPGLGVAVAP